MFELTFNPFRALIKLEKAIELTFLFSYSRFKNEKQYRVYSALRPYSLKLLAKQHRVYFVIPYSKNNRTTRMTFDFFMLVKLRALSLVCEEVICSDKVSPCSERVDYI